MAACSAPGRQTATGIVIAANGGSVGSLDSFALRTSDGAVLQFQVGTLDVSNGGLPAAHLREHLASGEPITVEYDVENGRNVALRYTDATGASGSP